MHQVTESKFYFTYTKKQTGKMFNLTRFFQASWYKTGEL